jgi:uncharacterized protein Veg
MEVKREIGNHIGKKATIKYNMGRNKIETYDVTIKELYDNVFLVECSRPNNIIKSFSYRDIMTHTIHIDY